MKTIEEKAKAYDEARERAKKAIIDCGDNEGRKRMIYGILPEMNPESEDEKAKKIIASVFSEAGNRYIQKSECDIVLAYLEKQKEQNEDVPLQPIIYTEQGEVLAEQKPAWSEFDKGVLEDAISATDILGNDKSFNEVHPNFAKAFRVAKDWLKSLPERFNLQPKQEWREEDERKYYQLEYSMKAAGSIPAHLIQWALKSLRPSWKPSEEQPSLPSALDEAARKSALVSELVGVDEEHLDEYPYSPIAEQKFKEGAEWMAGQGISMVITDEAKWAEVDKFVHSNCDGAYIIQIRKKD